MKKALLASLFAVMYAIFFSLGITCLWDLFCIAVAFGIDGKRVIAQYPRYIPFCLVVGFMSLIALFVIFMLNRKLSKKVTFSKKIWILEFLCAFVFSIPMAPLWIQLFAFLQKAF